MRISKKTYFGNKNKKFANDLTVEITENVTKLLIAVDKFLANYTKPVIISSGWRPKSYNAQIGGATSSNHITGLAIDLKDTDNRLFEYVLQNLELAKELGLYFEDKRWTPTWVHIQLIAPKSGKRIFVPNSKPALAPDIWDGKY
jgi:hypothetical protein